MDRCVVSVGFGVRSHHLERFRRQVVRLGLPHIVWNGDDAWPDGWPSHQAKPYAFKAYAMQAAASRGARRILWLDASIVIVGPLDRIWQMAAAHGVWASSFFGWKNDEWTTASAYAPLGVTREENHEIDHVSAGAMAVDLDHASGRWFLDEFYRLASTTDAFCGPWDGGVGVQHRHDQTAASVLIHRLGVPVSRSPDVVSGIGGEVASTILVIHR
jgi:hypothetical protein